ncbi:hypothetical protein [Modicisalibacter muralis]|nr:hypothetical protein [Halomonas muralis]
MSSAPPCAMPPAEARASRRRARSWWLAGLLVGCLLPAALVQAEALRLAERLTQICLMAPEAIRAESRRVARRKVWRCLPRRRSRLRPRTRAHCRPASGAPCADHDVLNRRGPPPWLA